MAAAIMELVITHPLELLAGTLNELAGRRMLDPTDGALPLDVTAALSGVAGVYSAEWEYRRSPVGWIPLLGPAEALINDGILAAISGTPLSDLRNIAWEGGLVVQQLFRQDVSFERGYVARDAEAVSARSFSWAGREPMVRWRVQTERNLGAWVLIVRAFFAQVGTVMNLILPGAAAAQRISAAKMIVQTTVMAWGIASLLSLL
ncbi:MAG: hypothetical protein M3P30_04755 [Chloroflexota bacterium]|nr:hypothetical protein [Chloroflexota bacterium]